MSYLAQEMMGFGKPSPLVEKIINGTINIVCAKHETLNPRQCSHCGSSAQAKIIDIDYVENGKGDIIKLIWYKCGCGHLWLTHTTFINQKDEKIVDDNI